jgi:hypothetical protein
MTGRYIQIGYHPETMEPVFAWLPDEVIAKWFASSEAHLTPRAKCPTFESSARAILPGDGETK